MFYRGIQHIKLHKHGFNAQTRSQCNAKYSATQNILVKSKLRFIQHKEDRYLKKTKIFIYIRDYKKTQKTAYYFSDCAQSGMHLHGIIFTRASQRLFLMKYLYKNINIFTLIKVCLFKILTTSYAVQCQFMTQGTFQKTEKNELLG